MLLLTSVIVKFIGAVYKIPLTAFIGAVGRGYFAAAYNVYLPVHALLMGAFPIALSRLVSKYNAKENKKMLVSLKKGSDAVFLSAGLIGTALIIAAAKPYSILVASSPKSVYSIFVLAPSLLFSCLAARYRGYFEGFMNMQPTSVSQTVEALFKMIFGLLFAKLSMGYMLSLYAQNGEVFGVSLKSEAQALSFIYPFTSAAAMLGVTLGSVISWIYCAVYYLINKDKSLPYASGRQGRRELLSFSFPIMISCSVQSVFQFLDTASVQYSLGKIPKNYLALLYGGEVSGGDTVTYAFGLFSTALDFKNLVPGITMALGICAVPAICREFERKNAERLKTLINDIYVFTSVLSCFGGTLIALESSNLLKLFYPSSYDIQRYCAPLIFWFGVTVPVYSLASTAVFCVQALGKPEKSVKSYVVSGIIRIALNVILIRYSPFALIGAVLSGAIGYSVLFMMNARLASKLSGVRFGIKNTVIKPIFVSLLSYFVCKKLCFYIPEINNALFNLLIETALFSAIYCILCFFVKLTNFKQIFCGLKYQKNGINA